VNYIRQMKLETFEYDGTIYNIKIGRSAAENTELVQNANKSDIWFHLSDSPSCHVVLTCETKLNQINRQINRQVISRCAYLCKMHSKTSHNCKVIYTQIENVKVTRTPGQVITTCCKTI
jgi:predicted ribosome quality control (RQC) complex YloA/Tae2 family protein